jgi:hypothetical protein
VALVVLLRGVNAGGHRRSSAGNRCRGTSGGHFAAPAKLRSEPLPRVKILKNIREGEATRLLILKGAPLVRRAIRLVILAVVLIFASRISLRADGSCEAMHLKSCPFNGIQSPCTYADGSPGSCTCFRGRWDCLL